MPVDTVRRSILLAASALGAAKPFTAYAADTLRGSRVETSPATRDGIGLRVTSARGGRSVPFCVGQPFRRGDVPGGLVVGASGSGLQSFQGTIKNRWSDGSAKFAILAGHIDLQPGRESMLSIRPAQAIGTSASQPSLDDLRQSRLEASVACSGYGAASWSGDAWKRPFLAWVDGPEMSSWIYRQPIGSDRHLVAFLEVRLYRSGELELLPWLENGYLLVAEPGERNGVVEFRVNGEVRFQQELQLCNHQRAVLALGENLSHWVGTPPAVTVRHDMRYFQTTMLVPRYCGVTPPNAQLFRERIATKYVPLARHNYPHAMGSGGYDPSIGPLPEWDVVYLTSDGDVRAWRAVQINGYAAGRYGYHFRDERSNRAPRISEHPHLALSDGHGIHSTGSSSKDRYTPKSTGREPPQFATTHSPAIGLMAYLVTGRWYFVDEMQLLASAMLLKQVDTSRRFGKGIIESGSGANTTRGAAWALRCIADAAMATPDDDQPLRDELRTVIGNNVDWYHERYIKPGNNPLGLVQPYSDYTEGDGKQDSASWMEDFLTWSFGNIRALELVEGATSRKLDEFVEWKYRSIVGRLGPNTPGHWSYRNAAAYTVPYAPSEKPDWSRGTGPWYPDWGAAYLAAGRKYESGDTLLGGYIESLGLAESFWGNLQPAIAYAVEQNAPGAAEAYERMTTAPNWNGAARHFNDVTPVWSVCPRTP